MKIDVPYTLAKQYFQRFGWEGGVLLPGGDVYTRAQRDTDRAARQAAIKENNTKSGTQTPRQKVAELVSDLGNPRYLSYCHREIPGGIIKLKTGYSANWAEYPDHRYGDDKMVAETKTAIDAFLGDWELLAVIKNIDRGAGLCRATKYWLYNKQTHAVEKLIFNEIKGWPDWAYTGIPFEGMWASMPGADELGVAISRLMNDNRVKE